MAEQGATPERIGKKPGMWDFGRKGWTVAIYQVIWFFFMTGMTVDGLNIIVPEIAAFRGWDPDTILSLSTPASIIALFLGIFFGGLARKFGLKKVMVITMFAAGISTILYANSVSIPMYAIFLVLMVTLIDAFSLILGLSICTNWFPTKKGVVMGFTTIGMNIASAVINQILNLLSSNSNIVIAISIMGCAIIVVGILTMIFIKETPEQAGCYPDNDPAVAEMLRRQDAVEGEASTMTYGKALKDPRIWILSVAYGFFGLATIGIMSQLAGFFMDTKGYTLQSALNVITIAALIGIVGSIVWGIVDQKIGTKKTSVIFGIWYAIGIVLLICPMDALMYVGIVMLGAGIGGNGNFPPSMTALVYGRKDFPIAYSVLNAIQGVVRSCAFAVLALLRSLSSGYTLPYIVFAIIALVGGLLVLLVKVMPVKEETAA